jgi:hypothetical protein
LRPLQPWRMILGSVAILLPSVVIFLVLSPDVVQAMLHWLSVAGGRIADLLALDRLTPAGGKPIEFGFPSCSRRPANEGMPFPPSSTPSTNAQTHLNPIIAWLVILAIFLATIFFVILMVRKINARRQARSAFMVGVEGTPIPRSLWGDLVNLLKGIGRRLWCFLLSRFRLRRVIYRRKTVGEESVLSIRALYRSLLHWAAKQGLPRARSQTALEYLRVLSQRFPQEDKELTLITDIYVHARYSLSPTSTEKFEAAHKAWEKIK